MVEEFTESTMEIIRAIKQHKEKYGNENIIKQYYEENGTYSGIVEFLLKYDAKYEF